jgi:hypothetical protein
MDDPPARTDATPLYVPGKKERKVPKHTSLA